APDGQVEFFLEIDEGPEKGGVQIETSDDSAHGEGADVRDVRIDNEVRRRRSNGIAGKTEFEAEESAQAAGDPFDGVQVRPIRKNVERHRPILDAFRARTHERDPIDAFFEAQPLAEKVDQILVQHVDVRHGRSRYHSSIYTISRTRVGLGRAIARDSSKCLRDQGSSNPSKSCLQIRGEPAQQARRPVAAKSNVLFLAAKPKDMAALVEGIATHIKRDSLVITLAAGVRTAFVEKVLAGRGRVVRIMPNLPCAVGEGATAFALGKTATEHD